MSGQSLTYELSFFRAGVIPPGFGAVFDGKIRIECFFWSPNRRRAQVSFRETH